VKVNERRRKQLVEQRMILQKAAATVKRVSTLSLRIQIIDFIQKEVQGGVLSPGDQIPSENDFADALQVNKTTVRSAFSELVVMGVLTRIPGKGTFVTPIEQRKSAESAESVAVIVADITGFLLPYILMGIQTVVEKSGQHIIFYNTRWDVSAQFSYLQSLRYNPQIIGMILSQAAGNLENVETVNMLRQWGIPFVEMETYTRGERTHYVVPDNVGGAYKLTKHLINLGHTKIGIIWSGSLLSSIHDRFQGYRAALEEAGLPFREEFVVRLDNRMPISDDLEKFKMILSVQHGPTAIFCFNDVLAFVFQEVCKKNGIRVPEDLAVVGFGDVEPARYTHPPLTTVAYQPHLLGVRAAEILLNQVRQPTDDVQQEVIETQLVVRESCGAKG
jgi:DNA-binding LacI/PurR family transcriptional regulator